MNNLKFLHDEESFADLISICAKDHSIEPSLIEKDYWIMHVLWSLKDLGLEFYLKGGTSLSKGYKCIHRFSEDIDLKIEPNKNLFSEKVFSEKNDDKSNHRISRKNYYDWLAAFLDGKINGILSVERDAAFDDVPKYRSGGIRLSYPSVFNSVQGLKEGILLECGFDRVAPYQSCLISSWAFDKAIGSTLKFKDNRAVEVLCYEPRFTFVEKLQAVIRKFRKYKEKKDNSHLPDNFLRHYYDIYQLIQREDVRSFIGTKEYSDFKKERFGGDDLVIKNSDAFTLKEKEDFSLFEKEFERSIGLYYKGRPSFSEILQEIQKDLERL